MQYNLKGVTWLEVLSAVCVKTIRSLEEIMRVAARSVKVTEVKSKGLNVDLKKVYVLLGLEDLQTVTPAECSRKIQRQIIAKHALAKETMNGGLKQEEPRNIKLVCVPVDSRVQHLEQDIALSVELRSPNVGESSMDGLKPKESASMKDRDWLMKALAKDVSVKEEVLLMACRFCVKNAILWMKAGVKNVMSTIRNLKENMTKMVITLLSNGLDLLREATLKQEFLLDSHAKYAELLKKLKRIMMITQNQWISAGYVSNTMMNSIH